MNAEPDDGRAAPSVRFSGRATIGSTRIFGPVKLDLPAARWTCILGPSGVGKTTLLRLMAGLGEGVTFDGEITAGDNLPVAPRCTMMAQSDLLFPWLDVVGNVIIGARLRREPANMERAGAVIEQVGLSAHRGKRPEALSGGERQRVALARTLMEDQPLVLLDEPFSSLDARSRSLMQELTAELLAGKTVLLVTHDAAEASRLGDRIQIMSPSGLHEVEAPSIAAIRPFDDPQVLDCQAVLLRTLRELPA